MEKSEINVVSISAKYSGIEIIPLREKETSDNYPDALDPQTRELEKRFKHLLNLRSSHVTTDLKHRRLLQIDVGGREGLFYAYKCKEPCPGPKGDLPENKKFEEGRVYGDVIIFRLSERIDRNGKAAYYDMTRRIVKDFLEAGFQTQIMNQIASF